MQDPKAGAFNERQLGKKGPGVGVIKPRFTVTLAERGAGAMPRSLGFGRLSMRHPRQRRGAGALSLDSLTGRSLQGGPLFWGFFKRPPCPSRQAVNARRRVALPGAFRIEVHAQVHRCAVKVRPGGPFFGNVC